MADERIDIEFEQIVPWNGANDTGRDVRLKWQRNFERVKTSMQALEQQIEQLLSGDDSINMAALMKLIKKKM